jgi:hypothetical protein
MLIALLAILGVDLIVIVVFAALVIGRRRWLKRQPGEFAGAIRVSNGSVNGLSPKWKHGCGRWVSNVLVWSKAPLLYRDELVPVDGISDQHPTTGGDVKRLGDNPVVIVFASSGVNIEVAAREEQRDLVIGPLSSTRATTR